MNYGTQIFVGIFFAGGWLTLAGQPRGIGSWS